MSDTPTCPRCGMALIPNPRVTGRLVYYCESWQNDTATRLWQSLLCEAREERNEARAIAEKLVPAPEALPWRGGGQ